MFTFYCHSIQLSFCPFNQPLMARKQDVHTTSQCSDHQTRTFRSARTGRQSTGIHIRLVKRQMHGAAAEKRAGVADPRPLVRVNTGLARRQDSRAGAGDDGVFVPVKRRAKGAGLCRRSFCCFGGQKMRQDDFREVEDVNDRVISTLATV